MPGELITQREMAQRRLTLVALFGCIVAVGIWIGITAYTNSKSTSLPDKIKQQMTPLSPSIDFVTLKTVQNRRAFSPTELDSFPLSVVIQEEDAEKKKKPVATVIPAPTPYIQQVPLPGSGRSVSGSGSASIKAPLANPAQIPTSSPVATPVPATTSPGQ